MFQGDIDPEIAALLGTVSGPKQTPGKPDSNSPGYGDLFGDLEEVDPAEAAPSVDLNVQTFPEVTKKYEDKPNPVLSDPDFYKKSPVWRR